MLWPGIALDAAPCYFGDFEYHFPLGGTFSVFLVSLGIFLVLASGFAMLNANSRAKKSVSLTTPGPAKERPVEPEAQIPAGKNAQLERRRLWLPLTMWVGILMVLLGHAIYLGGHYWRSTRTITALDIPLTLVSGHMHTPDFYINLHDTFYIEKRAACWSDYVAVPTPKARWSVFQDGNLLAQSEAAGSSFTGSFSAEKAGRYSVDLQFLSDPPCLKAGNPRLVVETDSDFYDGFYTFLRWLAIALVAPGLVVVVRSAAQARARRSETADSDPAARYRPRKHLPLKPRFSWLPSRGLVSMSLAIPIIFVMWRLGLRYPEKGFWVSIKPLSSNVKPEPWAGALMLRIGSKGRLYLNSTRISQKNLTDALLAGLARRADRVVFVDADLDLNYQDVISALDAIRGVRARIVLLTPGTGAAAR